MRRPAENLQGQRLIHATCSFLEEMDVLIFRIGDAAQGSAEAHADAMLRRLLRIRKPGIVERHPGRSDGKLRVAVESLQAVRRKIIFRDPVGNFAAAMRVEFIGVEAGDPLDAALFSAQTAPKLFSSRSDAGDRANSGNDCATSGHGQVPATEGADVFSRYAFMQR